MHNTHPEILKFARYCLTQGVDVQELAQQYADDNPLSYADYLLAHFCSEDILSCAEQMGWDISKHPEVVVEIASEISQYANSEYGINWDFLKYHIEEVFKSAPSDLKALAGGGSLDNYLEQPPSPSASEERGEEMEEDPPYRYGDYFN